MGTQQVSVEAPGGFALDDAWALHPQVAVRPEPFGALLYHFGSRRLSFLKDPALAGLVASLGAHPSARAACSANGLTEGPDGDPPAATAAALATLAATGMIVSGPIVSGERS